MRPVAAAISTQERQDPGLRVALKQLVRSTVLLVLVAGPGTAAPVPKEGELLYRRCCASCHGPSGRGDGPVAGALSPPPSDLTRSTGDVSELMRVIDGRRTVRAHGTAAMPVWGEVFEESLLAEPHARRTVLLHVRALAEFVLGLGRQEP
jgi:mono/diheme cytochrome c family protein